MAALKATCVGASQQLGAMEAAPVWSEALLAVRAAKTRAEAALARLLGSRARGAGGAPGSAAAFTVPEDAVPGGSLKRLKPAIEGGLSRRRPPPRPELGAQRQQLLVARAAPKRKRAQTPVAQASAPGAGAAPAAPRQHLAGAAAGGTGAAAGSAPVPSKQSVPSAHAAGRPAPQQRAVQAAGGAAGQPEGQHPPCPHGLTNRPCFRCDNPQLTVGPGAAGGAAAPVGPATCGRGGQAMAW
jgi:hypothetical protein